MKRETVKEFVIGILRDAENLYFLKSKRVREFIPPTYETEKVSNESWDDLYSTEITLIEESKEALSYQSIIESWQHLKRVTKYDASLLADILIILSYTTPKNNRNVSLPSVTEKITESSKPQRTASRPRGLVKYWRDNSLKGKSPEQLNIRDVLLDQINLYSLLEHLWSYKEEAYSLIKARGIQINNVDVILSAKSTPQQIELQLLFSDTPKTEKWQFPTTFQREMMPALRGQKWPAIKRVLGLFHELELQNNIELLVTMVRYLYLASNDTQSIEHTIPLLEHLSYCRQPHRLATLTFAVELHLYRSPYEKDTIELLQYIESHAPKEGKRDLYPYWLYSAFYGIKSGISISYLMGGIKILNEFYHHITGADPKRLLDGIIDDCNDFDYETVEPIIYSIKIDEFYEGMAITIWKNASKLPGFCSVLSDALNLGFDEDKLFIYLKLFLYLPDWSEDRKLMLKKWEGFKKYLPAIKKSILDLDSDYLSKWYEHFNAYMRGDIHHDEVDRIIGLALIFANRLSGPPFIKESYSEDALVEYVQLPHPKSGELFLSVSDKALQSLEKSCVRENKSTIIGWGLNTLTYEEPSFAITALKDRPKQLAKTMQVIGPMNWQLRSKAVKELSKTIFFQKSYEKMDLNELVKAVKSSPAFALYNPIPKALTEYLSGKRMLSEAQIQRHWNTLRSRILPLCLQELQIIGERHLKQGFELTFNSNKDIKHALKLYHTLRKGESKRAFKKFIDEYLRKGNTEYILSHPLTRTWLDKHSKIDLNIWQQGIKEFFADGLDFQIEREPLEVLKIGSYAGTCLGIGGIWTESAVATLLDINKQVLYLRDKKGQMIARQILAISDDDQLVAFEVYPLNSKKEIKQAFLDYDTEFAKLLGIPLYEEEQDENADYEISLILAKNWWDDYAWDLKVDEEES